MSRATPTDKTLLAAFYGGVAGLSAALVAYQVFDDSGLLLGGSLCLGLFCVIVVFVRWRVHAGSHEPALTVALGTITLGVIFVTAEVAVRLLEEVTPEGISVRDMMLLPREWEKVVAHRRSLWERSSAQYGVFVFDDMLGWTVGADRRGVGPHGETYFSSREGLRAHAAGLSLAGRSATKIALVGDSYTFASDVNYEDSWGAALEQQLGSGVQVLNFGVPGYGVDQAYLRYERDVRAWYPDVVVLAVISHDLLRSTMVYYQIGFPGAQVPGAKPRFVVRGNKLVPVNVPLPRPESVFASTDVKDLPFLTYDRFYRSSDWTPHLYGFSHAFRLAQSWTSQWKYAMKQGFDEETLSINRLLFDTFLRRVKEDGAIPVILFLPSYTEYRDAGGRPAKEQLIGLRMLDGANVPYLSALPCLDRMPESEQKFTSGWHYTPAANRVVAACLRAMLRDQPPGELLARPVRSS
jgi:hypothetical protein